MVSGWHMQVDEVHLNRKKDSAFPHRGRRWFVILLIAVFNLPILSTTKKLLSSVIDVSKSFDRYPFTSTSARKEQSQSPAMKYVPKSGNLTESIPIYNYKRPHNAPQWPKVAWLMSFPNSGTSYTGQLVRKATQTASATNYGTANLDESGNSVPLFDWSPAGPFLTDPKEVTTNKLAISGEGSYVLTKTHCGGYCFGCNPKYYLQTQEEFQDDCLTSEYMAKNGTKQKALYDPSIISKAIHLIRDPFDNVVSRFNLKRNAMVHKDDKEWLESYPNSKKGFRAFCEYVNTKNGKREKQHAVNGTDGSNVFLKYQNIPCYSDFIRYIIWHNHAIQTIDKLQIDSMTLHYESYGISQNRTVNKLLDFLGLNFTYKVQKYRKGNGYRDHFENEEIESVKKLAEEISDVETWDMLERYFD